jgi:putative SOS response-associated peptidase YedK
MCGRFVRKNSGRIPLRFAATADTAVQAALADRDNIAPTEAVPIVTAGEPGARRVELADWGLTPRWRGAKAILAFNARAATLTERPMFRGLVARSRCLIPASGWYEWTVVPGQKTKQPWFITDPDGDNLLGLAGLLDRWVDRDGTPRAACALVTTAAATDDLPGAARPDDGGAIAAGGGALARPGCDGSRGGAAAARAPGCRATAPLVGVDRGQPQGHSDPALIGPLNPA